MKIDIHNDTDWSTRDIRRVFLAAIKAEGMERDYYRLDVYYSRQEVEECEMDGKKRIAARRSYGVMGYGYYNQPWVKLGLPNTVLTNWPHGPRKRFDDPIPATRVAALLLHEFAHNRGLRHGEMADAHDVSFAEDLPPIRRKALRQKPDRETRARAEVERITAKLDQIERTYRSAIRRWRKKLTKAKASVRYYDKKAAMPPEEKRP